MDCVEKGETRFRRMCRRHYKYAMDSGGTASLASKRRAYLDTTLGYDVIWRIPRGSQEVRQPIFRRLKEPRFLATRPAHLVWFMDVEFIVMKESRALVPLEATIFDRASAQPLLNSHIQYSAIANDLRTKLLAPSYNRSVDWTTSGIRRHYRPTNGTRPSAIYNLLQPYLRVS
jgi:hypothetical protein